MKDLLKIYNYAKWQYKTSYSIPSVDWYRSANVPLDVPLRNQTTVKVAGRHITPRFLKKSSSTNSDKIIHESPGALKIIYLASI